MARRSWIFSRRASTSSLPIPTAPARARHGRETARSALRDEVALLEPVFARAGERFSLVGHSYGGGIALIAATDVPASAACDGAIRADPVCACRAGIRVTQRSRRHPRHRRRIGGGAQGGRCDGCGALLHRLLDGAGVVRPHARARPGGDCRFGTGHPGLERRAFRRADAAQGVRRAECAGAADGRSEVAAVFARPWRKGSRACCRR